MCVICVLPVGYTMPYGMFYNACHNNPHGYGIVIKREGQPLEVIRELPEKGNDPEAIYKILKDNEDAERYIHLRFKTQGSVSLKNTQPFTVYDDGKRRIEFMHNGTLASYNPPYQHQIQNGAIQTGSDDSDSKRFAEQVLQKYLPVMSGENGPADFNNKIVQELLEKYWSGNHNRGILIGSDLKPYFFNASCWEIIKTTKDEGAEGTFFASNNDYFKELKRGPLYEALLQEKRKKEAEEREKEKEVKTRNFSEETSIHTAFMKKFGFSEGFSDLMEDYDMYQPEGYIALANLTYHEMQTAVKSWGEDDVTCLLLYLTSFLKTNTEKLLAAEKLISGYEKNFESAQEVKVG